MTQAMMLGRKVEHDERSRNFGAVLSTSVHTVLYRDSAPVLDQGNVSSCTGNALSQCLNTSGYTKSRPNKKYLTEPNAVSLYMRATVLDEFDGTFPPDDTGSSGLAVCKAGVEAGYLSSYRHAFGFDEFLAALMVSPLIIGTEWREDMFYPNSKGFISYSGKSVGGHEYLAIGANVKSKYVTCLNSWSSDWGLHGRFKVSFPDFQQLLQADGDVIAPVGV